MTMAGAFVYMCERSCVKDFEQRPRYNGVAVYFDLFGPESLEKVTEVHKTLSHEKMYGLYKN